MTKEKLVYLAIAIVFCGALLSYFARPKAPHLELVSPEQISPGAIAEYASANSNLAEHVLNSYGLALVLVQSSYSPDNANALEALRSWARDNYVADKGFLHPISLEQHEKPADTVFGAFTFNVLGGPYYFLQSKVGDLVRSRVAAFQESQRYISVSDAYFELFGDDPEAAVLLARYQSDRAKQSLDVVMSGFVWVAFTVGSLIYIFTAEWRKYRFIRLQKCLAFLWLLLGASYFISATVHNEVGTFMSALLATAVGLYSLRPFVPHINAHGIDGVKFLHTNPTLIAIFTWATWSLICMQMLSWMKTPLSATADPLTLLFSAVTGDFMHEHSVEKQAVKHLVALLWVVCVVWVMWVRHRDGQSFVEDRLIEHFREEGPAAEQREPALTSSR